jgi:hypothetical protein
MHCTLWTCLDILTACLVLVQYQAAPGLLHFRALKHLVGYLRLHPDLPMTFNRSSVAKEVSAMNFDLLDPEDLADHVGSAFVKIVPATPNPTLMLDSLVAIISSSPYLHKRPLRVIYHPFDGRS